MSTEEPAETPLVLGFCLQAPSDEPPDLGGTFVECPTCGTTVGPVAASVRCLIVMTCPCGNRLEAWPE